MGLQVFLDGAIMMSGLIVAVGAQNTFVLQQGLLKQHTLLVASICWLCDMVLMAFGIAGMASASKQHPLLMTLVTYAGVLFLVGYGVFAALRAWRGGSHLALQQQADSTPAPARQIAWITLAITLLNPHVYLDTVWLIGSVAAPLNSTQKMAFWMGASTLSGLWFYGLAFGARVLLPWFRRERVWQILDGLIAVMMFYLAWRLLLPLWTKF